VVNSSRSYVLPKLPARTFVSYSHHIYISELVLSVPNLPILDSRDTHLPIAALLHLSEFQRAEHLSPETARRVHESQLVVVDDGAFPDEVDFRGLEEFGFLDELPGEESHGGCGGVSIAFIDVVLYETKSATYRRARGCSR
jgi:hypothetical protein